MSIDKIKSDEQENIEMPFIVKLIHTLASSKGAISKIFADLDSASVLKMLKMMGEDDAISYIYKDKRRISAYITSKNPSLQFKKNMNHKWLCNKLLMYWFISNIIKEDLISISDLSSDDFENNNYNKIDLHINLVEKLLSRDDLLRAYIALGSLLSISDMPNKLSEQEMNDFVSLFQDVSKEVIDNYMAKIKMLVSENIDSFKTMILKHEKEYESLAVKYEEAAKDIREYIIPEDSVADGTKKLKDSLEKLKKLFTDKLMKQEKYKLSEGETLDTLEDMKIILEKIEFQKEEHVNNDIETVKNILQKAKSICLKSEEKHKQPFVTFREKIDILENQLSGDPSCVASIVSGNHVIVKLLRYIENTEEKKNQEEIGMLLLDLPKFCGSEDSNSIIGNLMVGNITLEEIDTAAKKPGTAPNQTLEERISTTIIRRRALITPNDTNLAKQACEQKENSELQVEKSNAVNINESVDQETDEHPITEATLMTSPAEEKEEQYIEEKDDKEDQAEASVEQINEKQVPSQVIGGILPSRTYAQTIKASLDQQGLENILWALIYEDDIPGAYWLSRVIELKYDECIAPSWLLMATQGARWIGSESLAYVDDLLNIAKTHRPEQKIIVSIMGLAAAIRPSLIQPGCGLIDWLQKPEKYSLALIRLVESVKEFSKYGKAIMPEEVQGVISSQDLNARILQQAEDARLWLKDVQSKKAKFRLATEVWKHLSGSKGEIYELLQPVINNDKNKCHNVKANVNNWQRRDYVEQKIDEITGQIIKLRSKKIVGPPRQHIIRNVELAYEYAYAWCQLIDREQEYGKKENKLSEQIKTLQKNIQECVPELNEFFQEMFRDSMPAPISASFTCLARSLNQVLKDLNIEALGYDLIPEPNRQWQWLMQNTRTLEEAMGRRLIMAPRYASVSGLDLKDEQGEIFINQFCDSLAADLSMDDIFKTWIEAQDYRYIEPLKLGFNEKRSDELQAICDNAEIESKNKLNIALAETSSQIEQALVDGVITDEKHSEYNDQMRAIESSKDLNYRARIENLNDIQEKINNQREKRLIELKKDWEQLHKKMEGSSEVTAKKEQIKEFLQDALNRKDTRVVEESLAHLREVFDKKGSSFEEGLFQIKTSRDDLDDFMKTTPRIKEWLKDCRGLHIAADAIERGSTRAGINYGDQGLPRRKESVNAIEHWRKLKQQNPNARDISDNIAGILRFMAFNLEFKDGRMPVVVQNKGQDWLHCTANMSAGDLAKPVPQFGSLTRNRYDIICLWERPGADTIAARIRELRLDFGTAIVFYLGRLYDRQRRDLVSKTINAVLLDEILLFYLTKQTDAISRLPLFFRCALPYTVLNPYTPFQAGDVPPEMFFGRGEMIRELQKMGGSCIVFGGRQLGKSALLRRVQREFHNPGREQFTAVLDIKLLGDPKAMLQTSLIWGRIRESLKTMGLLAKNITTEKAEDIRKHINEVMRQDGRRKLILLFDESDNFLEADAKENFIEVESLRTMMHESEYRLKVVFAGLQNVLRFQGIPNQPLAHFGMPICVGPLEPDAAQRLVIEPLEAIGYRFRDKRTSVLRILSYTNYHPGLIQLFCQKLVEQLESTTGSLSPPFIIRQEDIEKVYRLDEVRKGIKERFEWTLALSNRYQAIVWSMVFDQMEMRDSYAKTYSPGNILHITRDWWHAGFDNLGLDELRGLLDEMCGLGVLVRNWVGHYRLRSPNLVRLLGTDEDIENNLLELGQKNPPLPSNVDNYHVPLDDTAKTYSPLSYYQERNINKQNSGTSLIFSSEALGLIYLKKALNKFVAFDEGSSSGLFSEMPAEILCADIMLGWLEKHMESHKKYENLVVYKEIYETDIKDMVECVNQALQFCSRHQGKKRWIRIYFVFDPVVTWQWVSLPEHVRKEIEDKADAAIFTRKWNLEGLKQRFAHHDKMHQDNILTQTLNTTGGWPMLVDILFNQCGNQDDVRKFLPQIENELKDPASNLKNAFTEALGIKGNNVVRSILLYLKDFGNDEPVPSDMLSPDYVGAKYNLTAEDCKNAVEYLVRMNCIDIQGENVRLDPVVRTVFS